MKKYSMISALFMGICVSCNFLDPLQNGEYTEENVDEYPKVIRGYVERAYNMMPKSYLDDEFIYSEVLTDNAVLKSESSWTRLFAQGSGYYAVNPFSSRWADDYDAILYCNMFLKDNIGYNTKMYVDVQSDLVLRATLQGDAFGMRAWSLFDLLKYFGGKGTNGEMLGVPFSTEPVSGEDADSYVVERLTYDECVEQILRDCDSALVYLPLANRDFLRETTEMATCTGSVRYHKLDKVAVHMLKAFVYLTWASPAFNPSNDVTRWQKAAEEAYWVIDHKLNRESAPAVYEGFVHSAKFLWTEPNSPEAIFVSGDKSNTNIETDLYPRAFEGTSKLGPSQELVDAFPMANGYPITDSRSGYDPKDPYTGRDPRFYATIFYDGANIVRNKNNEVLFTFNVADGGREAIGGNTTSPTGYYLKKFTYNGWCPTDAKQDVAARSIFFYRWAQACLIFAEAANKAYGPLDSTMGISAKDALAFLRNRTTIDDVPGLGVNGDPYLDECAQSQEKFDELVHNEWRLETCFEGNRFLDLRRWGDIEKLNGLVHGVVITTGPDGKKTYAYVNVDSRKYPSLWYPIPYLEMRKNDTMIQNEGWENWK